MPGERNGRVDAELQREIEQFLYEEAEILDERRLREWLDLFADDVRYTMPTRDNRVRREQNQELAREGEMFYFDDDKRTLVARVKRLETGMAWAEDPPSRTRHLVTNVRIEPTADGEYRVRSSFMLYRTRLRTDENLFVGKRTDTLRRTDAGWRIARREIVLDQNVIMAKNLSVFF